MPFSVQAILPLLIQNLTTLYFIYIAHTDAMFTNCSITKLTKLIIAFDNMVLFKWITIYIKAFIH